MTPTANKIALKIDHDDDVIRRSIADAALPPLMMSIVHITGDTSLLDGEIRPEIAKALHPAGVLDEEQKAVVREHAFQVLTDYRDRGCPPLAPLCSTTIKRMADFMLGTPTPPAYLPTILEEMGVDPNYSREPRWEVPVKDAQKAAFKVIIIGGGMSGILNAVHLAALGIPFTLIEKNADVGGTWFENTYPGCRVDNPNHFYSYSFEMVGDWPHLYSERDELYAYFQRVVEKYDVKKYMRFNTEVEEARWDEDAQRWHVTVRKNDGTHETLVANAVITAVGQLSRPKLPEIPGRDLFRGRSSHTSGFDRSIELAGKRVAVVGTGASAFQAVPEIAEVASKLTVFQRSSGWFAPCPDYYSAVSPGLTWMMKHVPHYADWYRFAIAWHLSDSVVRPLFKIDPTWPHLDRAGSPAGDEFRKFLTNYMTSQLEDRPDLLEKVMPKCPPMAKRQTMDNGKWLRTLKRDNVDLVTDGIAQIDENGVIDNQGVHHEVDVIIYATGFQAYRVLYPMKFTGRNGIDLNDYWGGQANAYLGITVPNFPNLFMVWGPGTSPVTSAILTSEWQTRYIHKAIKTMITEDIASLDCLEEKYLDYSHRAQAERDTLVTSLPGVDNWWKDPVTGKLTAMLPWALTDYFAWTSTVDLNDFDVVRSNAPSETAGEYA